MLLCEKCGLEVLLPSNWLKARTAAADQIIEIAAA